MMLMIIKQCNFDSWGVNIYFNERPKLGFGMSGGDLYLEVP